MLVITRKKDESILIGENIEIKLVKIEDGSVKLAISAPKDVSILRKELYVEIEEENKKAATLKDIQLLKNLKNK